MHAANSQKCRRNEKKCIPLSKNMTNVTVECVCPKCGTRHRLKLLWTGRGKPKKFCQPCKTFVTSIEQLEFYGVPTDINKGVEKAI